MLALGMVHGHWQSFYPALHNLHDGILALALLSCSCSQTSAPTLPLLLLACPSSNAPVVPRWRSYCSDASVAASMLLPLLLLVPSTTTHTSL